MTTSVPYYSVGAQKLLVPLDITSFICEMKRLEYLNSKVPPPSIKFYEKFSENISYGIPTLSTFCILCSKTSEHLFVGIAHDRRFQFQKCRKFYKVVLDACILICPLQVNDSQYKGTVFLIMYRSFLNSILSLRYAYFSLLLSL